MDSKKCRSKSGKKKDGFIVFCSQGAETEKAVKEGYSKMGQKAIILSLTTYLSFQ